MTAGDVIAQVDALEANQYSASEKLRWLSELDGQIFHEVIATHAGAGRESFSQYQNANEELLVPFPYDGDLYRWALIAQIRLHNAESARYNQAIEAFSAAYQSFTDWYNRTHTPRSAGSRFVF